MRSLSDFIIDEKGQATAEYAIIMVFVVVVVIIAINVLGFGIKNNLNESGNKIGSVL
jgi:Flp pilus assembly pilin Flp